MVALAFRHETLFNDLPGTAPQTTDWCTRLPVMRAFPRLAVEPSEEPVIEARWDEEPERWDGMA